MLDNSRCYILIRGSFFGPFFFLASRGAVVEKDDDCCWHARQIDGRNDGARLKPVTGLEEVPMKALRLFMMASGDVRYASD